MAIRSCLLPPVSCSMPFSLRLHPPSIWRSLGRRAPFLFLAIGVALVIALVLTPGRNNGNWLDWLPGANEPAHAAVTGRVEKPLTGATGETASSNVQLQPAGHGIVVLGLLWSLYAIAMLIMIYTLRHYLFTLNRLFARQRHPYTDIENGDWPTVTVFIAAHNEEAVIADSLNAVLEAEYPPDKICRCPSTIALSTAPVTSSMKSSQGILAASHPSIAAAASRARRRP